MPTRHINHKSTRGSCISRRQVAKDSRLTYLGQGSPFSFHESHITLLNQPLQIRSKF
ncbi:hypothetical protein X946_4836 [Burkholderia sp. ABCPW 111]|nr:hypothetical protein X946_4836 [Burkholderia sp. ABCPW 111]